MLRDNVRYVPVLRVALDNASRRVRNKDGKCTGSCSRIHTKPAGTVFALGRLWNMLGVTTTH